MSHRPDSAVRLYLVRHCQVDDRYRGRVYGDLDVPLSDHGLVQSRRLVERLRVYDLDAIYSSPLERAATPAHWMAEDYGIPHHVVQDFREVHRDQWRGLTWNEIESRWPGEPLRFVREPERRPTTGGEALGEVSRRTLAALAQILEAHSSGRIAIVAHSWVVRSILVDALSMPLDQCDRLAVDIASISIVEHGGIPRVLAVNLPDHVLDSPAPPG